MKKLILFILCFAFIFSASILKAENTTSTGYGKDDFVRTVVNGDLTKQEISDDFTFDSDADLINQIYKINSTQSVTTASGNTAANVDKGYYSGSIGGNSEIAGSAVFIKNTATQAGGSKSAIQTLHVHSETTTKVDRGIAMFGSTGDGPTTNFYLSTGDNTELIRIVAGTEGGFVASSLKDSGETDIACDAYFVVVNESTGVTYYIPMYNTLN